MSAHFTTCYKIEGIDTEHVNAVAVGTKMWMFFDGEEQKEIVFFDTETYELTRVECEMPFGEFTNAATSHEDQIYIWRRTEEFTYTLFKFCTVELFFDLIADIGAYNLPGSCPIIGRHMYLLICDDDVRQSLCQIDLVEKQGVCKRGLTGILMGTQIMAENDTLYLLQSNFEGTFRQVLEMDFNRAPFRQVDHIDDRRVGTESLQVATRWTCPHMIYESTTNPNMMSLDTFDFEDKCWRKQQMVKPFKNAHIKDMVKIDNRLYVLIYNYNGNFFKIQVIEEPDVTTANMLAAIHLMFARHNADYTRLLRSMFSEEDRKKYDNMYLWRLAEMEQFN